MVTQFHRGDLRIRPRGDVDAGHRRRGDGDGHGFDPGRAGDADRHRGAGAPARSGGARLEFKATVEVRVPLVGGKMENFIGNQLVELLIAEQRFTTVWITENA